MENYFIFVMLRINFWANLQRITELYTQKIVIKLSKIWAWDPESGSQKGTECRDLGVKKGTGR
jgi:hypothetical protein